MKNARITIKNYRGFTDRQPATFEIGEGFTALLGKNNAGKSSAKLLFYELRNLFSTLVQMNPQVQPGFFHMVQGAHVNVAYAGVTDPEELFNNQNTRPITVEIEVVGAAPTNNANAISKIVLTANRSVYQRWTLTPMAPIHRVNQSIFLRA